MVLASINNTASNCHDFLSYPEHKRHFEECFNSFCPYKSLGSKRHWSWLTFINSRNFPQNTFFVCVFHIMKEGLERHEGGLMIFHFRVNYPFKPLLTISYIILAPKDSYKEIYISKLNTSIINEPYMRFNEIYQISL